MLNAFGVGFLLNKSYFSQNNYQFYSGKQYIVMCQVLSPERDRPYVEASERKLQEVGFFGTSSQSREEIEKLQRESLSKHLLYISISFFPKFVN